MTQLSFKWVQKAAILLTKIQHTAFRWNGAQVIGFEREGKAASNGRYWRHKIATGERCSWEANILQIITNLLLTERVGRTGEYRPARRGRGSTDQAERVYGPQYGPE